MVKISFPLKKLTGLRPGVFKLEIPKQYEVHWRTKIKKAVLDLRTSLSPIRPYFAKYLKKPIKIVAKKSPTIADVATNCRKVTKAMKFAEVLQLPQSDRDQLLKCTDQYIHPEYWEIPLRESAKVRDKKWNQQHGCFQKHFSLSCPTFLKACLQGKLPEQPLSEEYSRIRRQCRVSDDQVVLVKDGDTGRRMIRSKIGYAATTLNLILTHSQEYQILPTLDRAKIAHQLSTTVRRVFPKRLRRGWAGKWTEKQLPYFYIFPKLSCHPSGPSECAKDHAHEREIFATSPVPPPVSQYAMWVAKAYRLLIRRYAGKSFRLLRMCDLSTILQRQVDELFSCSRITKRCFKCKKD